MTAPRRGCIPPAPARPGAERCSPGSRPSRRAAVRHGPGPLLLVAGPGTGKTRTLTHRVAHLLATGRAAPREILAVTFSVRAAGELRLRLADLLGEQTARGVTAATFHSVCARLLREHAAVFGRTDALHDLRPGRPAARDRARCSPTTPRAEIQQALARCGQPSAAELETRRSRWPRAGCSTPTRYDAASRAPGGGARRRGLAGRRRASSQRCNAFAFDDLLVFAVRLLREHPHRLAHLRGRWRWLVVDEMQDTNEAQAALRAPARRPGRQRHRASATTTRRSTASAAPSRATSCASATATRATGGSCSAATSARAPRSSHAAAALRRAQRRTGTAKALIAAARRRRADRARAAFARRPRRGGLGRRR